MLLGLPGVKSKYEANMGHFGTFSMLIPILKYTNGEIVSRTLFISWFISKMPVLTSILSHNSHVHLYKFSTAAPSITPATAFYGTMLALSMLVEVHKTLLGTHH